MKDYSFLNNTMLINGIAIRDFDEGDDVISISRREDSYTDVVGADGEMFVSQTANRSGQFVIKLQQGSSSATFLSEIFATIEKGTFQAVDIRFINSVTNELCNAGKGYIVKHADIVRGSGHNGSEWTFVAEDMTMFMGAYTESASLQGAIADVLY